jgi:hypothetical protein
MMPVLLLFWAVPAVIVVSGVGYYLVTMAELINAALALSNPIEARPDRRRKFKVIEGGRT